MATKAKTAKLSRQRDQRKALMKSLSESLIHQESIVTTETKARTLRPHIEKLVTKAKQNTDARRRLVRSRLNTDEATRKLFTVIAPRFQERPGGYTRLSSAGIRRGDNAPMMRISFIEETPEKAAESPAQASTDAAAESENPPEQKEEQ